MLKAVKVQLYPNREQKQHISSQIGDARYVYNRALALRKYAYTKFGLKIGKFALINHIKKLKSREKTSWLKEMDSQAIQQSIANMDRAYQYFFKGGGYPKFKSRHHFQYPHRVKIECNRVYLPKIGWVKMRGWRKEFAGKIKTMTVSLEAYPYHASTLIDAEDDMMRPHNNIDNKVGLDVGVSLIRAKAKAKLAKANLKIANKRKDFLHKLSFQYAENQGIVVVEDLKIKNMTKPGKGTVETPGKQVKQKQGRNRSITQQSWGMFFELLEYKLHERGGQLIKVDSKHTSQSCNECGHISKENRKSQAKFVCTACGHSANADTNAAKNILVRGVHGNNASYQIAV